jgi:hypothetical protein
VFDQLEVDPRPGQTALTGNFADQAQLHGLLDQLRDLGILLISVNPAGQAPSGRGNVRPVVRQQVVPEVDRHDPHGPA